ncbi:MAG: DUF2334 domain-containing protein [Clostridia bacterium]|nr:DUF2334 domain-containing protein [Clostridia bacterium]
MIIILKLDDLNTLHFDNFIRIKGILDKHKIRAGFGFVAWRFFEHDNPKAYFEKIKEWHNEGIEIWNHGFYHSKEEFHGSEYDYQKKVIKDTNTFLYDNTGIIMTAFGSPFNNSDETTFKVIKNEFPQIKCVMFSEYFNNSKLCSLTQRINIEPKSGVADYDFFVNNFNTKTFDNYAVIQGHPGGWDEKSFENFEKTLEFLKDNKAEFVTPSECAGRI